MLVFVFVAVLSAALADVYLEEKFQDGKCFFTKIHRLTCIFFVYLPNVILHVFSDSWEKNWIYSKHPGKEFGKFVLTAGKFFNNEENDKGMHVTTFFYEKIHLACFCCFS